MISESQQEQASLYALGLLDADEAGAFEQGLARDPELSEFVRDLQETAALLALAGEEGTDAAPPALRERVLAGANAPARPRAWRPWAIAALFMACAGILGAVAQQRQSQNERLWATVSRYKRSLAEEKAAHTPAHALEQVSFCALEPTPEFTTDQPRAMVLWDAAHRQGKLRINHLAPPAEGKDYQLWAVEAGRKDAVSAGVVHLNADGKADVPFQPATSDGKPVVAVAISLEKAGGSPTTQGPILLLGKL